MDEKGEEGDEGDGWEERGETYSPGGEATRMIMAMMVDEIDEADGFRNCDGMSTKTERRTTKDDEKEEERRRSLPYDVSPIGPILISIWRTHSHDDNIIFHHSVEGGRPQT